MRNFDSVPAEVLRQLCQVYETVIWTESDIGRSYAGRSPLYYERLSRALQYQPIKCSNFLGVILHDPIEDDEHFAGILKLAGQEAEAKLKETTNDFYGACHDYPDEKKRVLKERYNIHWFSIADLNPHCMFD